MREARTQPIQNLAMLLCLAAFLGWTLAAGVILFFAAEPISDALYGRRSR